VGGFRGGDTEHGLWEVGRGYRERLGSPNSYGMHDAAALQTAATSARLPSPPFDPQSRSPSVCLHHLRPWCSVPGARTWLCACVGLSMGEEQRRGAVQRACKRGAPACQPKAAVAPSPPRHDGPSPGLTWALPWRCRRACSAALRGGQQGANFHFKESRPSTAEHFTGPERPFRPDPTPPLVITSRNCKTTARTAPEPRAPMAPPTEGGGPYFSIIQEDADDDAYGPAFDREGRGAHAALMYHVSGGHTPCFSLWGRRKLPRGPPPPTNPLAPPIRQPSLLQRLMGGTPGRLRGAGGGGRGASCRCGEPCGATVPRRNSRAQPLRS
jgi:hypothetical protein